MSLSRQDLLEKFAEQNPHFAQSLGNALSLLDRTDLSRHPAYYTSNNTGALWLAIKPVHRLGESLDSKTPVDDPTGLFLSGKSTEGFDVLSAAYRTLNTQTPGAESYDGRPDCDLVKEEILTRLGTLLRSRNAQSTVTFDAHADDLKALHSVIETYKTIHQGNYPALEPYLARLDDESKDTPRTKNEKTGFIKQTQDFFNSSLYPGQDCKSLFYTVIDGMPARQATSLDMLTLPDLKAVLAPVDIANMPLKPDRSVLADFRSIWEATATLISEAKEKHETELAPMKGKMTTYVGGIIKQFRGTAKVISALMTNGFDEYEQSNSGIASDETYRHFRDSALSNMYKDHQSILQTCSNLAETYAKTDKKAQKAVMTSLADELASLTQSIQDISTVPVGDTLDTEESTFGALAGAILGTEEAVRPERTEVSDAVRKAGIRFGDFKTGD